MASIAFACVSLAIASIILIIARAESPQLRCLTPGDKASTHSGNNYFRLILACIASISAGASLSLGYADHVVSIAERLLDETPEHISVTLIEDSSDGSFLPRALCSMHTVEGEYANVIVNFKDGDRYMCGQELNLSGRLMRCPDSSLGYCWERGTLLIFTASHIEPVDRAGPRGCLLSFRERALAGIGSADDAHALLQALSCGYRASLSGSKIYNAFQTSGLAHVVAVSGAHLVIVTSLISSLLKAFRVTRRISITLLVLLMSAYTIMAGMPISCVRAALMSSVGIVSLFGKRRPSSLNALGITVFCIVCSAPHTAISSSFTLSALASIGIVAFGPLFELIATQVFGSLPEIVKQTLGLSLAASFLAQWYASALFKTLPLISPLANIMCAPLVPACCSFGLLAAVCSGFGLPIAQCLVQAASLVAQVFIVAVTFLANVPYASIPISLNQSLALACSALSGAFVWIAWKMLLKKSFLALCAAVAITLAISFLINPHTDAIYMLDVGQGDSFLVTSADKSMLIDTGNQDYKLLDQLARCHIAHLDCVVITHADDDHCGSLDALQKAVEVDTVFLADGMLSCEDDKSRQLVMQAQVTGKKVEYLQAHDVLTIGKFSAHVLWPKGLSDNGGNADSIVIELSHDSSGDDSDGFEALFTGDAESDELAEVMTETSLRDIDILKVAHHGSRNAMTPEQADLLNPTIALIGVGANNRYGHPHQETLEMLEHRESTVLRTDVDGGVKLQVESGKVIMTKL